MASQQGMSGIDCLAMLAELEGHLPLWVGKCYQYGQKSFGIRFNGEMRTKYNMIVEAGRRAHLTGTLPEAPAAPSGFAMFLRKYLLGGKVLGLRQMGLQRIFEIEVGKRETTYHLIVELFDEGNMVLCDGDWTIVKPLWHHRFRDREVVPGVRYQVPGMDHLPDLGELEEILKRSDRDIVRTCAIDLMLGGEYAEEVCRRAGISRETPAPGTDAARIYHAFQDLIRDAGARPSPVITKKGCFPLLLEGQKPLQQFPSFNAALDSFYPHVPPAAGKKAAPKLSREERIRRQQEEAITRFDRKIRELERVVETIYAHYPLISDIISTLGQARLERSWGEIEEILKASGHPAAEKIQEFHPAESAVTLALDPPAKIMVTESLEANVGRYYEQIKKLKRKKEGALAALERGAAKEPAKKTSVSVLKPRWYHRFRWMYTSDGVLVVGGRDASQNEELVKRYMEGGDTFVHADVHGGSVVLVKGTTDYVEEAAQFAASYSNAWKSGHFFADVYAAEPSQVSKTPESGEYVPHGAFIVRGTRTYFKNVPLGVAIGVQFEPALAVIGGAIAPITARTRFRVVLRPGAYEPDDIARKVVRTLREQMDEEALKGLKSVLNTEAVRAFVPPGGSEIVNQ